MITEDGVQKPEYRSRSTETGVRKLEDGESRKIR